MSDTDVVEQRSMDRIGVGGRAFLRDRDVQNMVVTLMHRDSAGLLSRCHRCIEVPNLDMPSLTSIKSNKSNTLRVEMRTKRLNIVVPISAIYGLLSPQSMRISEKLRPKS
jgi:hypothetical protein